MKFTKKSNWLVDIIKNESTLNKFAPEISFDEDDD